MMERLKAMFGSRKVILFILGIIYALLTVFREQFGFAVVNPQAVVMTLAVICVYIFGEASADLKRQKKKWFPPNKWKEPQFWLAIIGSILPVLTAVGTNIPVDAINGIIAGIIGLIYKRKTM